MCYLLDTHAFLWVAGDDPFDRLLAAQASHEGMYLVSRDPKRDAYPATRVWDRVYEKAP